MPSALAIAANIKPAVHTAVRSMCERFGRKGFYKNNLADFLAVAEANHPAVCYDSLDRWFVMFTTHALAEDRPTLEYNEHFLAAHHAALALLPTPINR